MSLTRKALWVIERNLDRPLSLGEIAEACGVSRHHLAHAFGERTGLPVMQYVRSRRLTEAAQALVTGAPDILALALEAGYASHEAFSRAFRAQFGMSPEMVRRDKRTEDLPMIKAMQLDDATRVDLALPRFVAGAAMLAVGLGERYAFAVTHGIAAQWQRFMTGYADIPNKAGIIPLGICTNMDDDGNFEYFCAAEVTTFSGVPRGLKQLRIPAQHYAVFLHGRHVSEIGATYSAIWNDWLPANGREVADGASLERHLEGFDPRTGLGGVEIWIPVKHTS